jgi:hypothetical protein
LLSLRPTDSSSPLLCMKIIFGNKQVHYYCTHTSNILKFVTCTAIPAVSFYVIIIFHQVEEEEEEEEDENLTLLPNLRIYGVIKVVTILTTPTIGNTEDVIAPTS